MNRPNWIGQTLGGRYRIEEMIGQGGMSAVYKAYDPNLRRVVAIKMIHSHLAGDAKFVVRFEEEATAVAQLRHPNIVQVYDFNHDDDLYYMVQEFVAGETLQERLRRVNKSGRRLPLSEAILFTLNICDAAGYAHRRGMIHRDIKPANIMLDVHSQAILMDFGIVKITGGESHTASGAVVGTALYMPPELIRGEVPDPRSDIYSLGVTLFEMVSGRPPFEADSAMTLMMLHLQEPVPDLRGLRPEVPDDLIAVIEKALVKERGNRFVSMAELATSLKAILDRLNIPLPPIATQANIPAAFTVSEEADAAASAAVLRATGDLAAAVTTPDSVTASPADLSSQPTTLEPPASSPADLVAQPTALEPSPGAPITPREGSAPAVSTSTLIEPTAGPLPPLAAATIPEPAGGILGGNLPAQSAAVSPSQSMPPPPLPPVAAPTSSQPSSQGNRRILLIAGGAVLILLVAIIAFFVMRSLGGGDQQAGETGLPTGTQALAVLPATVTPSPTATLTPTITPTPQPTETPTPTFSPTPTIPVGVPFSLIRGITVDNQGYYVVEYETFEYTEQVPGTHVHFFFNTLPLEEAGKPGNGPWYMWGGPRPFNRARLVERPDDATQMCILVANPDHSVQFNTGNCFNLPDIVVATTLHDTACLGGPAPEYPQVTNLNTSQVLLVHGLSPNELYWNVANPLNMDESCWVERQATGVSGDISTLPLVEAPPMPTGAASTGLSVQITGITLDEQNRYLVDYQTQGFTEQIPGTHIHFFFNTVTPEQLNAASGNLLMHGGPAPFTGYTAVDRPAEATQMCALVANPNHTVIIDSGNCFDLPDS